MFSSYCDRFKSITSLNFFFPLPVPVFGLICSKGISLFYFNKDFGFSFGFMKCLEALFISRNRIGGTDAFCATGLPDLAKYQLFHIKPDWRLAIYFFPRAVHRAGMFLGGSGGPQPGEGVQVFPED